MTTDRILRASQDSRLTDKPASTSQDAALRGASLAWKPPVKPKPNINTYNADDGALAAATKVGNGGSRGAIQHDRFTTPVKSDSTGDQTRLGYQITGGNSGMNSPRGSSTRRSPSRARMSRLDNGGFLQPSGPSVEQSRSPSLIAATLAASRSASISPNPTGQKLSGPELRPRSSFMKSPSSRRSSSRESSDHVLDTTSIPPTTSLIGMFEKNAKVQDKGRRSPVRKATIATAPTPLPPKQQKQPPPRKVRTPSPSPLRPPTVTLAPKGPHLSLVAPLPMKPEISPSKPVPFRASEIVAQPKPQAQVPQNHIAKPIPIETLVSKAENGNESSSSNDSFVSASDNRPTPPPRASLTPQHRRLTSASATSVNSLSTINSMANAIVASSLASSRAASPSKQLLQPPPPPPSRRNPRNHLFHNHKEASRTPSPSKQGALRTTMRKPRLEAEIDEGDKRRSKKHIMKKHPNKHNEGDRKRWRDEITERERKRYEAVWASNKGLHLSQSFPGSEYSVCNLVVRDIFSRSRLHTDVLEEVYELVDRGQNGALEKEEFVVGLWLIDQRLKGRKLPIRVSDHVWRSVGSLKGIKVRKAGK